MKPSLYAVIFDDDNPPEAADAALERLRTAYGDPVPPHRMNRTTILVHARTITAEVAETAGIKARHGALNAPAQPTGAVFEVHPQHRAGRTCEDLWAWFQRAADPDCD